MAQALRSAGVAFEEIDVDADPALEARFGERVPVPVTTFSPIATGGVNQQPITSFNYENIGVNIDITPRTHHDDDVSLNLRVSVTNISGTGFGGLPTFGNREINTVIRLRDGETNMLAGLIRDEERTVMSGIPGLSDIPGIGEIFFSHNILVYIAFLLVPIYWFVLNKTTLGLKIRSVGENPEAADSLGVNVGRIRYFTIILGGTLSGIAGASLSIALLNVFQQNMTSGSGFIAVALVYFGAWRPIGVLGGALLFSMINSLQLWIQVKSVPIPSEIAIMMPYVLTILVLVATVSRVRAPSALTKPFEREN